MNPGRSNVALPLVVPAFRLVANLEAISWAGLLIGMLFKYGIAARAELGHDLVSLFGAVHGGLVLVYVALAIALGLRQRWRMATLAVAVAATVPPFATVAFDAWALRSGRYGREARA